MSVDYVRLLAERLDALRAMLRELQEGDSRFEVPPPVREEQVVAFEQKYSVALPVEFRAILTQVSDGLGIWKPIAEWEVSPREITTPFRSDEMKGESREAWDPDSEEDYDDWLIRTGEHLCFVMEDLEMLIAQGTVCLKKNEEGGGDFLVVTGDSPGTVWRLSDSFCSWDDSWSSSIERIDSIFAYIDEVGF